MSLVAVIILSVGLVTLVVHGQVLDPYHDTGQGATEITADAMALLYPLSVEIRVSPHSHTPQARDDVGGVWDRHNADYGRRLCGFHTRSYTTICKRRLLWSAFEDEEGHLGLASLLDTDVVAEDGHVYRNCLLNYKGYYGNPMETMLSTGQDGLFGQPVTHSLQWNGSPRLDGVHSASSLSESYRLWAARDFVERSDVRSARFVKWWPSSVGHHNITQAKSQAQLWCEHLWTNDELNGPSSAWTSTPRGSEREAAFFLLAQRPTDRPVLQGPLETACGGTPESRRSVCGSRVDVSDNRMCVKICVPSPSSVAVLTDDDCTADYCVCLDPARQAESAVARSTTCGHRVLMSACERADLCGPLTKQGWIVCDPRLDRCRPECECHDGVFDAQGGRCNGYTRPATGGELRQTCGPPEQILSSTVQCHYPVLTRTQPTGDNLSINQQVLLASRDRLQVTGGSVFGRFTYSTEPSCQVGVCVCDEGYGPGGEDGCHQRMPGSTTVCTLSELASRCGWINGVASCQRTILGPVDDHVYHYDCQCDSSIAVPVDGQCLPKREVCSDYRQDTMCGPSSPAQSAWPVFVHLGTTAPCVIRRAENTPTRTTCVCMVGTSRYSTINGRYTYPKRDIGYQFVTATDGQEEQWLSLFDVGQASDTSQDLDWVPLCGDWDDVGRHIRFKLLVSYRMIVARGLSRDEVNSEMGLGMSGSWWQAVGSSTVAHGIKVSRHLPYLCEPFKAGKCNKLMQPPESRASTSTSYLHRTYAAHACSAWANWGEDYIGVWPNSVPRCMAHTSPSKKRLCVPVNGEGWRPTQAVSPDGKMIEVRVRNKWDAAYTKMTHRHWTGGESRTAMDGRMGVADGDLWDGQKVRDGIYAFLGWNADGKSDEPCEMTGKLNTDLLLVKDDAEYIDSDQLQDAVRCYHMNRAIMNMPSVSVGYQHLSGVQPGKEGWWSLYYNDMAPGLCYLDPIERRGSHALMDYPFQWDVPANSKKPHTRTLKQHLSNAYTREGGRIIKPAKSGQPSLFYPTLSSQLRYAHHDGKTPFAERGGTLAVFPRLVKDHSPVREGLMVAHLHNCLPKDDDGRVLPGKRPCDGHGLCSASNTVYPRESPSAPKTATLIRTVDGEGLLQNWLFTGAWCGSSAGQADIGNHVRSELEKDNLDVPVNDRQSTFGTSEQPEDLCCHWEDFVAYVTAANDDSLDEPLPANPCWVKAETTSRLMKKRGKDRPDSVFQGCQCFDGYTGHQCTETIGVADAEGETAQRHKRLAMACELRSPGKSHGTWNWLLARCDCDLGYSHDDEADLATCRRPVCQSPSATQDQWTEGNCHGHGLALAGVDGCVVKGADFPSHLPTALLPSTADGSYCLCERGWQPPFCETREGWAPGRGQEDQSLCTAEHVPLAISPSWLVAATLQSYPVRWSPERTRLQYAEDGAALVGESQGTGCLGRGLCRADGRCQCVEATGGRFGGNLCQEVQCLRPCGLHVVIDGSVCEAELSLSGWAIQCNCEAVANLEASVVLGQDTSSPDWLNPWAQETTTRSDARGLCAQEIVCPSSDLAAPLLTTCQDFGGSGLHHTCHADGQGRPFCDCDHQSTLAGCACEVDLRDYCLPAVHRGEGELLCFGHGECQSTGIWHDFDQDSAGTDYPWGNNRYACHCQAGYLGQYCEINPCGEPGCGLHGSCRVNGTDMTSSTCQCDTVGRSVGEGLFSGPLCDEEITEACGHAFNDLLYLCDNAGACVRDSDTDQWACQCEDGFSGRHCEVSDCPVACGAGVCKPGSKRGEDPTCLCFSEGWVYDPDSKTCVDGCEGEQEPILVADDGGHHPVYRCGCANGFRFEEITGTCSLAACPLNLAQEACLPSDPPVALDPFYQQRATCQPDGSCQCDDWLYQIDPDSGLCRFKCDPQGTSTLRKQEDGEEYPCECSSSDLDEASMCWLTTDAYRCHGHGSWSWLEERCSCQTGWLGPSCEEEVVVCDGRGEWLEDEGFCSCWWPFLGEDGLDCLGHACHRGTPRIVSAPSTFYCHCPPVFHGEQCEQSKCVHGDAVSQWVDGEEEWGSRCVCHAGWMGQFCDTADTCWPGGQASPSWLAETTEGSLATVPVFGPWDSDWLLNSTCACLPGRDGPGCLGDPCGQYGHLTEAGPGQETWSCNCDGGWTGAQCNLTYCGLFGSWHPLSSSCTCQPLYEGERCLSSLCLHGGIPGNSACLCPPGWTGVYCEDPIQLPPDDNTNSTGNTSSTGPNTPFLSSSSSSSTGTNRPDIPPSSSTSMATGSTGFTGATGIDSGTTATVRDSNLREWLRAILEQAKSRVSTASHHPRRMASSAQRLAPTTLISGLVCVLCLITRRH